MAAALGFLLSAFTLEGLCFAYFFLAPVFLPYENVQIELIVFGLGYLFSGGISGLALAERLCSFSERIGYRKFTPLILLLIGSCFVSLLINTPHKLIDPGSIYTKYLKLILPVIASFVMINIWTYRDLPKLYALILRMAIITFIGLLPEAIYYLVDPPDTPRFGSFFLEPNKYALFLNVLYGMTLPHLITLRLRGQRSTSLIVLNVAILFVLCLTQSRSGIMTWALLTGIAFYPRPARGLFVKLLPLLGGFAGLMVLVVLARYFNGKTDANYSDLTRAWTYLVGLNIVSHRPFTGIGFANIIDAYREYGGIYTILMGRALGIHNTPLEIWAEEGFFGMIFYLLLMFGPVRMLVKRMGERALTGEYPAFDVAAVSIPIAFFCFGFTYPNYLADDYFWVYMAYTFVAIRSPAPPGTEFRLARLSWL
jgi:O-antigen ligase